MGRNATISVCVFLLAGCNVASRASVDAIPVTSSTESLVKQCATLQDSARDIPGANWVFEPFLEAEPIVRSIGSHMLRWLADGVATDSVDEAAGAERLTSLIMPAWRADSVTARYVLYNLIVRFPGPVSRAAAEATRRYFGGAENGLVKFGTDFLGARQNAMLAFSSPAPEATQASLRIWACDAFVAYRALAREDGSPRWSADTEAAYLERLLYQIVSVQRGTHAAFTRTLIFAMRPDLSEDDYSRRLRAFGAPADS